MADQKEMEEKGKLLFQSAENIRNSSADLNSLMDTLWEKLEKLEKLKQPFRIEWVLKKESSDANNWVTTGYSYDGMIIKPGKGRKELGNFTYMVRLCGLNAVSTSPSSYPWLNQACFIMAWNKFDDDWRTSDKEESYWYLEQFDQDDSSKSFLHHLKNGLWAWRDAEHHNGKDYAFFFVLPLFVLNSEEDLEKFVVKPFVALFNPNETEENRKDLEGTAVFLKPVQ